MPVPEDKTLEILQRPRLAAIEPAGVFVIDIGLEIGADSLDAEAQRRKDWKGARYPVLDEIRPPELPSVMPSY